ncbi:MAG: HAMP domain-containing sensor histidine kinase [Candidatus Omnitrophota bacterium]|jgi:signal transduction histidine kinase
MNHLRHNLVTLLFTIKGFVEAYLCRLEEGRFRSSDDELQHAREMMRKIYEQTGKALLITQKIGLAMKAADATECYCQPVSIHAIWKRVLGLLEMERARESVTEVIEHIPKDFPKILCDSEDLTEILYCLAENAIQAMRCRRQTGKLVIRASLGFRADEERVAQITVADTGPGMAEETLSRLFHPFVTTKAADQGNGLGLCLVKGLARKNGGTVSVSSFQGCGTTFTLTFSLAPKAKEEIRCPENRNLQNAAWLFDREDQNRKETNTSASGL